MLHKQARGESKLTDGHKRESSCHLIKCATQMLFGERAADKEHEHGTCRKGQGKWCSCKIYNLQQFKIKSKKVGL